MTSPQSIGLVLSGGGVRAAVFHAGVLKYLAEQDLLGRVSHVSSVSGGSLFTGMVFKESDYSWPTSTKYLEIFLPRFRKLLVSCSLQRMAFGLLLKPINWRFALSRANVVAQAVEKKWGVTALLGDLDVTPVWSINCCAGETGRRFRFKNGTFGDYELGYANAGNFKLAQAMAISAAFPGGIGPLVIETSRFSWMKRSGWGESAPLPHEPPFSHIHLYDGGIYDNLGLEPLFDGGKRQIKNDNSISTQVTYLLVSDAGAPLSRKTIPGQFNPLRFKRIADIALEQTRALRVRSFVNFLQGGPDRGVLVGIGSDAKTSVETYAKSHDHLFHELSNYNWLSAAEAKRAAEYKTSLDKMSESNYDLLLRHGYETAKWNIEIMHYKSQKEWPTQKL